MPPSWANPVAGKILPHDAAPVPGQFRVTATYGQIDASHPTPHNGVDIGNGSCGATLLAMASGRITMNQYLNGPLGPNTVLVVRGIDAANPSYEWAIAHCASVSVKVGQIVTVGQPVGILGKTGTAACHAHLGCKHNGVEEDIWPHLAQNQQQEAVVVITVEPFTPVRNWTLNPGVLPGVSINMSTGAVAQITSRTWTKASSASTDQRVTVGGVKYLHVTNGVYASMYVPEGPLAVVQPPPPPAGTLTQADVDRAVATAIAPLKAKLDAIEKVITG